MSPDHYSKPEASDPNYTLVREEPVSLRGRSGIYDVTVTTASGDVIAEFRGRSRTTNTAID